MNRCTLHKILFVVRGEAGDAASSRYRVYQYLQALDERGIGYRVVTPPRRKIVQAYLWVPWLCSVLFHGMRSDTIFVQKDIFSLSLWHLFKRVGKKIVYDFDDAVFVEAGMAKAVYSFPSERRCCAEVIAEMVRLSDLTIVANDYLAEFARPLSDNIKIIPMSLDLKEYPTKASDNATPVVIGWIGSPQTVPFLSLAEQALEKIALRYEQRIEIRIVTNGNVMLPRVPFRQIPWIPEKEVSDILSFDVGIVPLPEDSFTKGKSSFKLLQFMACGLPTVCSAVGFNSELIQNGKNGYIVGETNEWAERLAQLIEDAKLRRELGLCARKTVATSFSLASNASLFMGAITNL